MAKKKKVIKKKVTAKKKAVKKKDGVKPVVASQTTPPMKSLDVVDLDNKLLGSVQIEIAAWESMNKPSALVPAHFPQGVAVDPNQAELPLENKGEANGEH